MKLISRYLSRLSLGVALILVTVMLVSCTSVSKTTPTTSAAPSASTPTRTRPAFTRPPASSSSSVTESPAPTTVTPTTPVSPAATPSSTPPPATATPTTSSAPLPASNGFFPGIVLISPAYGSTVPPGDVTISVLVSNFKLVDKQGQSPVAGEGHIIYYMDAFPPVVQGKTALSAKGTYAISTNTSYTWHNLKPGVHFFSVQLVNNNNTPLNPAETFTEYVTVQENSAPTPLPSLPASTP